MFFVKRIIVLFVTFHTIYYVCKGVELDNTVNNRSIATQSQNGSEISENFCAKVCGEKSGVLCGGDQTSERKIVCMCEETHLMFDIKSKECKENLCTAVCGEKSGVTCEGVKTSETEIKCTCDDKNLIFDTESKECKENFCSEVCGEKPGVICDGVKTRKRKIQCTCENKDLIFDKKSEECKENLCAAVCGEKSGVTCGGVKTSETEIECTCENKDLIFDKESKECKVLEDACNGEFPYCIKTGGSCVSDGKEIFHCKCPSELYYVKGIGCKETCDVFNSKCENGGECEGSEKHKFCICKKGTSGDRCEIINDCKDELHCRYDKAYCSYDTWTETAFCKCNDSKKRYDSETSNCITIDVCILKMIKKECSIENEVCEGGECKCMQNYKYSNDKNFCEEDGCSSCPTGSLCGKNTGYSCKCKVGEYSDGRKCVKYGKCEIGISKCEQKCDAYTGKCTCAKDFILRSDNITCEKTDKISICDASNCHPGICVQGEGKRTCICPEVTHKAVNNSCIDICTLSNGKPPESMKCPVGSKCETDGDHGVRCKCEDPYEQAEDGIHCKRKKMCKEQLVMEQMAERFAFCRETEIGKGYEFYCDRHFKFDKDGVCKTKCEFMENDCLRKFAVCELDQDYDAICQCPPLLKKKGKDGSCSEIANVSYSGKLTLLNSKYVVENESYQRRKISADLIESTYSDVELKKDLKAAMDYVYGDNLEDVKLLETCKSIGDLLECKIELQMKYKPPDVNALTSAFYCYIIDEDFCLLKDLIIKRENNVFQQTDPCILEDMFCDDSTKCMSDYSKGTFKCICKEGFRRIRSFPILTEGNYKEICADIDECKSMKTNLCPGNTTCINTYGSYVCECNAGFKRKYNNLDPKRHGCEAVCDPNPCENEGECIQNINRGFICRCKPMYSGLICNETAAVKKDVKCVTHIGGLIGTGLVLFFIIVVVVFVAVQRMKLKKNNHDDYCRRRQQCVSGDVIQVQKTENEYVEIDLHSSTRQRRQNNVEFTMQEINIRPRVSAIPRAHTSRDNNADQYLEDRCSTYDVPRKLSDVRSEEDKTRIRTMEYPNKAYGLEE